MANSAISSKPFRREIELDFVRGIAILMVLDFHAVHHTILSYPLTLLGFQPFGWIGVDIFFVLSGFLVGGLLVKEWMVRGRIDSKRFLIRRGFKIWPQYYCFLLLMLVIRHRSFYQLWGNFLNIQNYVGGVAHTWTLAVEEHAYLFLVLCLVVASLLRATMRHVFFFFIAVIVVVIALRLFLSEHGVDVFSTTHTRIDGILYGVLLAILYHHAPEIFHRLQERRWIWIGALGAALIFFRINPQSWWGLSLQFDFANLSGIALLMLLYRHEEGKKRVALYRFVAWIGLYSYGIYLWHVSVVAPMSAIDHRLPSWWVPVWDRVAPPIAGIVAGIVMTRLVEFPTLKLRDRLFPRPVDSAVGIPGKQEAGAKSEQAA